MDLLHNIAHGYHQTARFDAFAGGVGQEGFADRFRRPAGIFVQIFQESLHTATVADHSRFGTILLYRRPRNGRALGRPVGSPQHFGTQKGAAPYDALPGPQTPGKKGGLEILLSSVFQDAERIGLIDEKPEAAIDSTGLEATVRSAHYARRRRDGNRRYRKRKHPKLTIVCHTQSHLIAAAIASVGPSYDAKFFAPAVRAAAWNLDIDRLLADAGYDSEPNHRMAREHVGIRSTVISLNPCGRRPSKGRRRQLPAGRYRRQMKLHFPCRKYGQRWQVESVISRIKRRLGSALRGRSDEARRRESDQKVFTHDLMILAGAGP
jgi:hypothetical protein